MGNSRYIVEMNNLISVFNQRSFGDNLGNIKIRPHWGQLHDPSIYDFSELYPELPKWRISIERLKKGSQLTTFETKFANDRNLL